MASPHANTPAAIQHRARLLSNAAPEPVLAASHDVPVLFSDETLEEGEIRTLEVPKTPEAEPAAPKTPSKPRKPTAPRRVQPTNVSATPSNIVTFGAASASTQDKTPAADVGVPKPIGNIPASALAAMATRMVTPRPQLSQADKDINVSLESYAPRCVCHTTMKVGLSNSAKHPGRRFFKCALQTYDMTTKSVTGGCNSFIWVDEILPNCGL